MAFARDRACRRHAVVAAVVLTGAAPALLAAQRPAAMVFDGVTVVDVEQGKLRQAQRVVIVGNRITAVGGINDVRLPAGARVVDAKGKYLIPGLWDLHTHSQRAATKIFYPLFLANGVTGIRDAASEVPLDTLHLWRREILRGTRVGPPRQVFSGKALFRCPGGEQPPRWFVCANTAADARRLVDSQKTAGADMIKNYVWDSREVYSALAAEALRVGLPLGGHIDIGLSDSGTRIIDHLQSNPEDAKAFQIENCFPGEGSIERCRPIVERLKRNNTWLVPTIVTFAHAGVPKGKRSKPIFDQLRGRLAEYWASRSVAPGNWLHGAAGAGPSPSAGLDSVGTMALIERLGLPIVAGTDVGEESFKELSPGFALHAELAMSVAEGLTPLRALQSATLNPAKMLGATDSLGTVAPGKLADLVLLDADPLADITNTTTIRAVVANGRYFDRAALDKVLAEVPATPR